MIKGRMVAALLLGCYVIIASAVTVVGVDQPSLFNPAGTAALIFAPLAVVGALVGGYVIGIPWLLGLTDADPDEYGVAWVVPFVVVASAVNAGAYLWVAAWLRRRRRRFRAQARMAGSGLTHRDHSGWAA